MSWQLDNTYKGWGFTLSPHGSISSATDHTLAIPVVSPVNIILESFEQQIIVTASSCAVCSVLRREQKINHNSRLTGHTVFETYFSGAKLVYEKCHFRRKSDQFRINETVARDYKRIRTRIFKYKILKKKKKTFVRGTKIVNDGRAISYWIIPDVLSATIAMIYKKIYIRTTYVQATFQGHPKALNDRFECNITFV